MKLNNTISIIIPTFNPKIVLCGVVKLIIDKHNLDNTLKKFKLTILIVNDGSNNNESIFLFINLLSIAEQEENYADCVKYIDEIQKIDSNNSFEDLFLLK